MRRKLEICCGDIESVMEAVAGGADRIELCSALNDGGLTPSNAMIRAAVETGIPVNVLIRPRCGDFLYTPAEVDIMCGDIAEASNCGAKGVVIGALLEDGSIDIATCSRLCGIAHRNNLSVTFHRAFDMTGDPFTATQQIIDLGCARLLTSGHAPSAIEGIPLISKLQSTFADRLIILAGAGVNPANVGRLLEETNVSEVHASASSVKPSLMTFRNNNIAMGADQTVDEYVRKATSKEIVSKLADIVHN